MVVGRKTRDGRLRRKEVRGREKGGEREGIKEASDGGERKVKKREKEGERSKEK